MIWLATKAFVISTILTFAGIAYGVHIQSIPLIGGVGTMWLLAWIIYQEFKNCS